MKIKKNTFFYFELRIPLRIKIRLLDIELGGRRNIYFVFREIIFLFREISYREMLRNFAKFREISRNFCDEIKIFTG
jgi:hypothetical protein